MSDGENKATDSQGCNPAGSNDVLFGWLVGRAAADLGLAQALAASEAQRAEQFKRLEDNLLAQIRDLQTCFNTHPVLKDIQVDELKTQIEKVVDRMGGFESVVQQLTKGSNLAIDQARSLESLDQRQSSLEAQYAQTTQRTSDILQKIETIEQQITSLPAVDDRAVDDLGDLKQELLVVRTRLERAESAHKELENQAARDVARIQQAAESFIRTEVAELREQVKQLNDRQSANGKSIQTLAAVQQQIEMLQGEVSQSTQKNNKLSTDLAELRVHSLDLVRQVESLGSKVTSATIDFEAERMRLDQEIVERIAAKASQFWDEMRQSLREIDELKTNRKAINDGIDSLADRICRLEQASEELATAIRSEVESAQKALYKRESQQAAIEAQFRNFQEVMASRTQQLMTSLAELQQRIDGGEAHHRQLNDQFKQTDQRIAEIESTVHQTRSSLINECAETVQQRNELVSELSALRTELHETQRWEADIRVVEDRLTARVHGLESQLAEKISAVERRYTELGELSAQLENFGENLAVLESQLHSQQSLMSRGRDLKPVNLDSVERIGLPDEGAKSATARIQDERQGSQPEPQKPDQPPARGLVEPEDPLPNLRARMSADIERARAELREKSGRWKLRQ